MYESAVAVAVVVAVDATEGEGEKSGAYHGRRRHGFASHARWVAGRFLRVLFCEALPLLMTISQVMPKNWMYMICEFTKK